MNLNFKTFPRIHPLSARNLKMPRMKRNKADIEVCKICNRERTLSDSIICDKCHDGWHLKCLEINTTQAAKIAKTGWQCEHCKLCSVCATQDHEDLLVLCDLCDRATHTYCAIPKLKSIPSGIYF